MRQVHQARAGPASSVPRSTGLQDRALDLPGSLAGEVDPGLAVLGHVPGSSVALALQRAAGNAAVSGLVASWQVASDGRGAVANERPALPSAVRHLVPRASPRRRAARVQRKVEDKPAAHPVLRWGSHQPEVETLQQRLNEEAVADPPLVLDSIFGPLTNAAVREFQARHGLSVDGVVGLRTWGVLDELERQGIAGPTSTVLDEMAPVDKDKHDAVEKILHPTQPKGGGTGPAMTGTGKGGAYEKEMVDALNTLAAEIIARPVATPAVNMDHANRVGDRAQVEAEAFFSSAITLASRKPTGDWHPGSSRMGLADATTRPLSEGDILGWTEYFMDNGSYPPAGVGKSHNFDNTRAKPDRAEHDRVRDVWLASGGRAKASQMIRSWPAEAGSGTVYLQLRDPAYQDRVGMWDLFGTLVHEFLHLVTHPNYSDTADAIGGGARDILVEGMDDHMAQQVWPDVRDRIAGDPGLRTLVEGPFAATVANANDYDEGGAIDKAIKAHHYDSMADADKIATQVGESNARGAFFMGHVEALGIGPSSASAVPLTGLASWTPTGGGTPDEYITGPGAETVEEIRKRTGSTHLEDEAGFVHVDPADSFVAGTKLKIPGLRWHTAIAQDTRAQVANQHGITQADLERANRLPHRAPNTAVSAGTLLMIPVAP